jgi:hypothetical protein
MPRNTATTPPYEDPRAERREKRARERRAILAECVPPAKRRKYATDTFDRRRDHRTRIEKEDDGSGGTGSLAPPSGEKQDIRISCVPS